MSDALAQKPVDSAFKTFGRLADWRPSIGPDIAGVRVMAVQPDSLDDIGDTTLRTVLQRSLAAVDRLGFGDWLDGL